MGGSSYLTHGLIEISERLHGHSHTSQEPAAHDHASLTNTIKSLLVLPSERRQTAACITGSLLRRPKTRNKAGYTGLKGNRY
jgi:hypothetical protein